MAARTKLVVTTILVVALAGGAYAYRGPLRSALGLKASNEGADPKPKEKTDPDGVDADAHTQQQLGVETAKAVVRQIVERVKVPGTVAFDERLVTHLRPRTKGRVLSLSVQPGDAVTAGETLATLDASGVLDAKNGLQSAKATLAEARTGQFAAEVALKRAAALLKIGGIAEAELERRQVEAAKAKSAVQTAQAQLDNFQAQYERLAPEGDAAPGTSAVVSPIAGVVTSAKVTVGEVVDTTQDVFTVADPRQVLVMASLYGPAIAAVKPGDPTTVDAPFPDQPDFAGHVRSVNADLDPLTNAASARIEVDNRGDLLKGNMYVNVAIDADLGRRGVTIPASAVQRTEQGQVAFVRTGATRFERRILTLGLQRTDWVEVKKGVAAGEDVATKGSFGLKAILLRSLLGSTD